MASNQERLRIFENIIAKVGLDGDVLGEYSKAMSTLNGLQTYQEMNPPQPTAANIGSEATQMPTEGTNTPEMGGSIPEEPLVP